jgi:hypothetical protein
MAINQIWFYNNDRLNYSKIKSKEHKDDGVWVTNLFSIAQHQAFGTKCVSPSMIA